MPTDRSYHDACGIARALDVVGERWALLVLRELLFGPQRFAELRLALSRASSNVLADRLRELERHGVIARRKLAPPSASWVYELTPWGRELEPVVLALGDWGLRVPLPPAPVTLGPTSVLIYLRRCARPDPATRSVVRIDMGGQVWTARSSAGQLTVTAGEEGAADAVLATDPATLNDLIGDPDALDRGISLGTVRVSGDVAAVRQLVGCVDLGLPA